MKKKMNPSGSNVPREKRRWVSGPHKVHEERLRRRAGAAYSRLQASGDDLAAAIGKHHSTITHRKEGQGPLANLLIELDDLVRAGHDIASIYEAIHETELDARGPEAMSPRQLAVEEQEADAAEDVAGAAYLAGVGSGQEWSRRLLAQLNQSSRMIRALRGVA